MAGLVVTVGEVVKTEHRQETFVSGGSAGGGVVTMPDGRVFGVQRPTAISTEIVSTAVIWLRTDTGTEIEFRVAGDTFPCRESHRVGFVHTNDYVYTARNFTSRQITRYYDLDRLKAAYAPKRGNMGCALFISSGVAFLGAIAIFFGTADATFQPINLAAGIVLFVPLAAVIVINFKNEKRFKQQVAEADQNAKAFFAHIEALESNLTER